MENKREKVVKKVRQARGDNWNQVDPPIKEPQQNDRFLYLFKFIISIKYNKECCDTDTVGLNDSGDSGNTPVSVNFLSGVPVKLSDLHKEYVAFLSTLPEQSVGHISKPQFASNIQYIFLKTTKFRVDYFTLFRKVEYNGNVYLRVTTQKNDNKEPKSIPNEIPPTINELTLKI